MVEIGSSEMPEPEQDRLFVWDLPLRLFHWGLAAAVVTNVVTANIGRMDLHERSGLTVLGLVAFRIVWGFVGGHHAIFANFVRMPWTVLAWLRAPTDRAAPRQAGHSPLAALSVLGLLAVTGFMAVTGMFSTDGILFDGRWRIWHLTGQPKSRKFIIWQTGPDRAGDPASGGDPGLQIR